MAPDDRSGDGVPVIMRTIRELDTIEVPVLGALMPTEDGSSSESPMRSP